MTADERAARPLDEPLERLAPLGDPVRRRIYAYVAQQPDPVSRDRVAQAVAISRPLAAFHLERLLKSGLLVADLARPAGAPRRRGRPEKRYRTSPSGAELSVPPRSYALVAGLFADALAETDRPPELDAAAAAHGRALGRAARSAVERPRTQAALVTAAKSVLAAEGFMPRDEPAGRTCLANCPFEAVAARHRDVTCPTNLALVAGVLDGAGVRALRPRLDPAPGRCCVVLEPAHDAGRVPAAPPEERPTHRPAR